VRACQGRARFEITSVALHGCARRGLAAQCEGVGRKLHPPTKERDLFCGGTARIHGIEQSFHFGSLPPV
jgi:hypothetical protein